MLKKKRYVKQQKKCFNSFNIFPIDRELKIHNIEKIPCPKRAGDPNESADMGRKRQIQRLGMGSPPTERFSRRRRYRFCAEMKKFPCRGRGAFLSSTAKGSSSTPEVRAWRRNMRFVMPFSLAAASSRPRDITSGHVGRRNSASTSRGSRCFIWRAFIKIPPRVCALLF